MSPAQYDVDPTQDKIRLRTRQLADTLREQRPVECNYLRHVRDRILRETGKTGFKKDVPRCIGPLQIAREWYA